MKKKVKKEAKRKYPVLSALKGRIREKGSSYEKIGEKTGHHKSVVSNYLNGYAIMNGHDMNIICDELNITNDEIAKYFFPHRLLKATNQVSA